MGNHEKIKNKFIGFQCPFMVDLLLFAGFEQVGDRLVLKTDNIELVLNKMENKKKAEEDRLEQERLRVIQQNKEQMELASQGIYNVKATVADRKGTGSGVNSLTY